MVDMNRAAQILTKDLKAKGIEINKVDLLDTVARMSGYEDWEKSKVTNNNFSTFAFEVGLTLQHKVKLSVKAKDFAEAARSLQFNLRNENFRVGMYSCNQIVADYGGWHDDLAVKSRLGFIHNIDEEIWQQNLEMTFDDPEASERRKDKTDKRFTRELKAKLAADLLQY